MPLNFSIAELIIVILSILLLGLSFALSVQHRKTKVRNKKMLDDLGLRFENFSRRLKILEQDRREVKKLLANTGGSSQQDLLQEITQRIAKSEARLAQNEAQMQQSERLLNEMLQALS